MDVLVFYVFFSGISEISGPWAVEQNIAFSWVQAHILIIQNLEHLPLDHTNDVSSLKILKAWAQLFKTNDVVS